MKHMKMNLPLILIALTVILIPSIASVSSSQSNDTLSDDALAITHYPMILFLLGVGISPITKLDQMMTLTKKPTTRTGWKHLIFANPVIQIYQRKVRDSKQTINDLS